MESLEPFKEFMQVLKDLDKRCMSNSLRVDGIEEQLDGIEAHLETLEKKLQNLFWFIEFHLGEVPMKYRKFNPLSGEYPYLKLRTEIPKSHGFLESSEMNFPKDSEILKRQACKMKIFGEKQKALEEEKKKEYEDLWMKHRGLDKEIEKMMSDSTQDSSAASLKPLELQDSPQACKHPESSQSSNEPPDHNNPPSPSVC